MNVNPSTQCQSPSLQLDTILLGDCTEIMFRMPAASVDFILTDPPYAVNFCDRPGRNIRNDNNASWLHPAFAVAYRLLKPDRFFAAWRAAGFYPVGHLVFRKRYASTTRFVRYQHEQACLLAKGEPPMPASPIPDVLELSYTGNKFHPTQKAVSYLLPIVSAFSPEEGIVLDPFCGSASSLLAAKRLNHLTATMSASNSMIAISKLPATAY